MTAVVFARQLKIPLFKSKIGYTRFMNWKDYLASGKEVLLEKPSIKGTIISVEHMIGVLAQGWSEEQILKSYPRLTKESL